MCFWLLKGHVHAHEGVKRGSCCFWNMHEQDLWKISKLCPGESWRRELEKRFFFLFKIDVKCWSSRNICISRKIEIKTTAACRVGLFYLKVFSVDIGRSRANSTLSAFKSQSNRFCFVPPLKYPACNTKWIEGIYIVSDKQYSISMWWGDKK